MPRRKRRGLRAAGTDRYRQAAGRPGAIRPKLIVNRLQVIEPIMEMSTLYGRPYFTGDIKCKCLGPVDGPECGKTIIVKREYFWPFRPERSKYSCGCCSRPRKKSARAHTLPNGRPHMDLAGQKFGALDVVERVWGVGWKCLCSADPNLEPHECYVPWSHQLLKGTITACIVCRPWDWERKRKYAPRPNRKKKTNEQV